MSSEAVSVSERLGSEAWQVHQNPCIDSSPITTVNCSQGRELTHEPPQLVTSQWFMTNDELPILGPIRGVSGYLNATGGFRTGIVASPLTAQIVAQCVFHEPWEAPLEPYLADRFEVTTSSVASVLTSP